MKQLLLSLVLVAACLGARAQAYYLDLSHQRLEVPGRTVAVEQVLDGRHGDLPMGYAYRGLSNNRPLAIAFRQGLGPELTAYIQRQLPARPTDRQLVLCLRQLHLNEEHTLGIEGATAYLNLDVYLHLPDGYHFVQSIASHTAARAPEVTKLHAVHLARMLNYCLGQLAQADWARGPAQPHASGAAAGHFARAAAPGHLPQFCAVFGQSARQPPGSAPRHGAAAPAQLCRLAAVAAGAVGAPAGIR
jgi:hypothetical protein